MVTHSRTSSGATPRSVRQHRASLLLLAVMPLPGCITTMVWEPPPDKVLEQWEDPELQVHAIDDGALLIKIPDTLRRAWGFEVSKQARWLHLEAEERDSLRTILRQESPGRMTVSWQGKAAPTTMHAKVWLDREDERLRSLPGVRSKPVLVYRIFTFETECRVTLLDDMGTGERRKLVDWIELCRVEPQPNSVWTNLAWTPLALLGDVVLAPFELIWWLDS